MPFHKEWQPWHKQLQPLDRLSAEAELSHELLAVYALSNVHQIESDVGDIFLRHVADVLVISPKIDIVRFL